MNPSENSFLYYSLIQGEKSTIGLLLVKKSGSKKHIKQQLVEY